MRILLKGGPFHDHIIGIPNYKTELLMPIPGELTAALVEDDMMTLNLKVARYIKTSMQGYGHYNDVYPVWMYDGEV